MKSGCNTSSVSLQNRKQGTSRFLAQGGADPPLALPRGGGHFEVKEGHPDFLTNNMIFLECGVIALFEAHYMFRDHNFITMLQ